MIDDEKELGRDDQPKETSRIGDLYGWQCGSVIIPPGFDLTKPIYDPTCGHDWRDLPPLDE